MQIGGLVLGHVISCCISIGTRKLNMKGHGKRKHYKSTKIYPQTTYPFYPMPMVFESAVATWLPAFPIYTFLGFLVFVYHMNNIFWRKRPRIAAKTILNLGTFAPTNVFLCCTDWIWEPKPDWLLFCDMATTCGVLWVFSSFNIGVDSRGDLQRHYNYKQWISVRNCGVRKWVSP